MSLSELELKTLTLASAAEAIREKQLSPVELTRAVLGRAARLNDFMRAFITITEDVALKQASTAEKALMQGEPSGPLHGVPVVLKDLFDTKGIRTTAGAKVFSERIPEQDSAVARSLKDHGAVLVGKANMHEFAFGVTNVNPHYGTARNPWDPERVAGGSSGGSASAVTLSLGLAAVGSDTGGSIRIPAAACGIVGLKPTYGLVSMSGAIPLSWSLDHAGPMTRTVADAALMLGALSGNGSQYVLTSSNGLRGVRIGVPSSVLSGSLSTEVDSVFQSAVRELSRLGAEIADVEIPGLLLAQDVFKAIAAPEAAAYHEPLLQENASLYGVDVRERLENGRRVLATDYVRAQRTRGAWAEQFSDVFSRFDAIVTPTLPVVAPRIEECRVAEPVLSTLSRYTRIFNLVGMPAISVPCGFSDAGLPIGLQIAGKLFDEQTILRIACVYEQDTRWFERRPET